MATSFPSSSDSSGDNGTWSGKLKPFMSYRTRYSTLSSVKERSGSTSSMASFSGSTQNLLDPTKLMSLQDDARCRRISAEVMKRCLYKSDAPCRRRAFSRVYGNSGTMGRSRMVQSMPVTPAQSHTVSPAHSPTNMTGSFYSFLSRGTTPRAMSPESENGEDDDSGCDAGIASILRPQPRYVRALPPRVDEVADESADDGNSARFQTNNYESSPRPSCNFRSLDKTASQNSLS